MTQKHWRVKVPVLNLESTCDSTPPTLCPVRASLLTLVALVCSVGWPPLWGQVPRAPALTVAEQSPAAVLRQALELYRTASYAEAARGFEHYLKTHPDSLPTRKLLAHCYLRLEQPKLAMRVLRVVIARLPKDVAAHQALRKAEKLLKQQRELEAKKPKPEEI